MNLNEIIQSSPLFFELADSEIEFLMKRCRVREVAVNSDIFVEGDKTSELYLVLDGKVLIHKMASLASIRMDELNTGDIFGVSVFSEEKKRDHRATALTHAYILEINFTDLEQVYNKNPKLFGVLMLNIARLLAKRLARSSSAMLDIAELTQRMGHQDTEPSSEAQKPLVYVIEDDVDVGKVLVDYLEEHYEVQAFTTPVGAIELVQQGKIPDIFITDFMMPEMSGIELTEFLKEEKVDKPIVFVTGVNQFKMASQAINLGVFSLIEKPFSRTDLLLTVKSALRERFLLDFNGLLLNQYTTLFHSLSQILQSIDSQNFASNLKGLLTESQAEFEKIIERKKRLGHL